MIEMLLQTLLITVTLIGFFLVGGLYVAGWLAAIHHLGKAYYFKEAILPMIAIVVLLYGGVFAVLATLPKVPVKAENVTTQVD